MRLRCRFSMSRLYGPSPRYSVFYSHGMCLGRPLLAPYCVSGSRVWLQESRLVEPKHGYTHDICAAFGLAVATGALLVGSSARTGAALGQGSGVVSGVSSLRVQDLSLAWRRWVCVCDLFYTLARHGCPFIVSVSQVLAAFGQALSLQTWSASYLSWVTATSVWGGTFGDVGALTSEYLPVGALPAYCVVVARPVFSPRQRRILLTTPLPTVGLTGDTLSDAALWRSMGFGATGVASLALALALVFRAVTRAGGVVGV